MGPNPSGDGVPPVGLPSGAALADGEQPLLRERFMLGTVVFYLHTELALTNRRLYAARPNTLFGLIPAGTARRNFPLESIAGVSAGTRINIVALVLGVLALLIGFGASTSGPPVAVALLVIGVLLLLAVPRQAIEVMNSGGGTIAFPVSVFERGKTVEFANRVSEVLARKPSSAGQPQSAPPSGSDANDALRNLTRLREDGLVTDEEFTAKRAEILARL
jgi:Short C-terminal domain